MITFKIVERPKANKKGEKLIALRITFKGKHKFIGLGVYSKPGEFKSSRYTRKAQDYLGKNQFLLNQEQRAEKIIRDIINGEMPYSHEYFTSRFNNSFQTSNPSITEFITDRIEVLESLGKIKSAKTLKDTHNTINSFQVNKSMHFQEMDYNYLSQYVNFLIKRGYSDGGIGVRLRDIRAIYNLAIKQKIVKRDNYPFNDFKVSKFKSGMNRKALSIDEVKAIQNIEIEKYPHLTDAYHYFIFSYFTGGMNFKDMVMLTWNNIEKDRIKYQRSKTKKHYNFKLNKIVKKVLEYYRIHNKQNKYVFPILLHNDLTAKQIENRKTKALKQFNKKLKELGRIACIDSNITSYVIRHSFATNLKFKGVSTEIVSQSMGHSNPQITERYLKSFGDNIIDDALDKLLEEPAYKYNAA